MKQSITYSDGNILSYSDYGNPDGYPILIQHGLISSIQDYDLFDGLISLGTRLISIARPGYGQSSPYRMKNIAEWADVVSVLVEKLGLSHFDILAMSSGSTYGYAIGYGFPEKARNLFVLSGIPALYDENIITLWPYPSNRDATLGEMQQLAHELFFSNLSGDELAKNDIQDSMMNNCFGIAQDFMLRARDWGFGLPDVKVKVYMQHSKSDNLILAEMTSKLLPNCSLKISDREEHFSKALVDDFIKNVMAEHY